MTKCPRRAPVVLPSIISAVPVLAAVVLFASWSLVACDSRGSSEGTPAPVSGGRDAGAPKVDTGSGTSAPMATTPQQQCRNLLLALCDKDTACGSPPVTATQCLAQFTMTDCSRVTGVSSSYDTCLAQIPTSACPLTNVPAACTGVLIN